MRAFLLEEQRIVKKVLKAKAGDATSKEESAAPATATKEAEKGKETAKKESGKKAAPKKK